MGNHEALKIFQNFRHLSPYKYSGAWTRSFVGRHSEFSKKVKNIAIRFPWTKLLASSSIPFDETLPVAVHRKLVCVGRERTWSWYWKQGESFLLASKIHIDICENVFRFSLDRSSEPFAASRKLETNLDSLPCCASKLFYVNGWNHKFLSMYILFRVPSSPNSR